MKCITIVFFTVLISFAFASDPTFISREEWGAKRPKSTRKLKVVPPPFVVVHHSAGSVCTTTAECKSTVKAIQNFHMDTRGWKDIGYNFLVGGDGFIYEGRGWNIYGAHAPSFNSRSIGICVLGNFQSNVPTAKQLNALENLIAYAVRMSYVTSAYKLIGHRQANPTTCPGNKLFAEIETWPHFELHPV